MIFPSIISYYTTIVWWLNHNFYRRVSWFIWGKKNNDLIVLPQPGMVAGIGVTIPKQPFSGQWISEINQISDVVWQFNLPEEFQ